MELFDGTVLPTYLVPKDMSNSGAHASMSDFSLRIGEVVDAIAPNDPRNQLRPPIQWEYVVNVAFRDSTDALHITPYRCTVADTFGSLADHVRHTVRNTNAKSDVGGQLSLGLGATVLVLCVNGDRSDAIIIGGRRHLADQTADPSSDFFEFEFNGVRAFIDKDGALSLVVPGATKVDGTPADTRDSNNHGSTVSVAKDGAITVSDQNGDTIVISPKDKTITTTAGSATTTVDKTWKLKAGPVEIEADSVVVKSQKILLGDDEININPLDEVVVGSGIDTFTGLPFKALGDTTPHVKAKKE